MPHKTPMDKIRPLADAIAVHRNQYSSGGADYSVTTLLDPPRVVFLNKRHLHKVKLYVQDLLYSYTGTAQHEYWEKMLMLIPNTPYECEKRLSITVNNRIISGAFDCVYATRDMYDLKTTSCWKVMFGSKDDWTAQQNIYRWLYHHHNGVDLNSCRIIGVFRDWSIGEKFRKGRKYPTYPAMEYRLPVWEYKDTLQFMEDRTNLMIKHENTEDIDLPECSYEDMWSEPDSVAVMSTRLKSKAVRVLSSQKAAENFIDKYLAGPTCKDSVKTLYLQQRPAQRKRCENWCPVNRYCTQWQEYTKSMTQEV